MAQVVVSAPPAGAYVAPRPVVPVVVGDSPYVVEALRRKAEERTTNENFAKIFQTILKPEVMARATSGANAGTCTITGDPVISLEQYISRLASVGVWEIDPMDESSLIPKGYKANVHTASQAFPPGSAAIRLLAFTNQFLTTISRTAAQTQLIKTSTDLETAFDNHARRLVGGVPLAALGKDAAGNNFLSTAPTNVADGWRIVRYREVPTATNAFGTVSSSIQLSIATPSNYTVDLLFADKDIVLYCQLDGGEAVRYPLALPTPGLEPVCPDQKSARRLAVRDLVDLITAKVKTGGGRWILRGDSLVATQPDRDGIPILQIAGLPIDLGATGTETSNHGNLVLIAIKELQPAFGSGGEKSYILTLGYLGEKITQTPTPGSPLSISTTGSQLMPGATVTTATPAPIPALASVTSREVIVVSEQKIFGDKSLLVYACPYL